MAPFRNAQRITPGTPVFAKTAVMIACEKAGMIRLVMEDGTKLDVYAQVGTAQIDNLAVVDVDPTGTTATATVSVMG